MRAVAGGGRGRLRAHRLPRTRRQRAVAHGEAPRVLGVVAVEEGLRVDAEPEEALVVPLDRLVDPAVDSDGRLRGQDLNAIQLERALGTGSLPKRVCALGAARRPASVAQATGAAQCEHDAGGWSHGTARAGGRSAGRG